MKLDWGDYQTLLGLDYMFKNRLRCMTPFDLLSYKVKICGGRRAESVATSCARASSSSSLCSRQLG